MIELKSYRGLPLFPVKTVRKYRRDGVLSRVVSFLCPFCGTDHQHGAPLDAMTKPDHRASHCHLESPTIGGGYFVIDEEHYERYARRARSVEFPESEEEVRRMAAPAGLVPVEDVRALVKSWHPTMRVGLHTVIAWIHLGRGGVKLVAGQVGGQWYVPEEAIRSFLFESGLVPA